ncbi:MAG: hypothetical protein ACJA0H_000672 [Francisellaceae bacterium]|jgi:hypothetical protein
MRQRLKLNLELARVIQLTCMFAVGFSIFIFSYLPHKWWVILTVLIISAAYEPGLLVKKSWQRGRGTLVGLVVAWIILSLLDLNFRFIPLILIIIASITYAIPARIYGVQTACVTVFIFISYSLLPTESSVFQNMVDRAICTSLGIIICMAGDYLLFAKYKYSKRNYSIMQREICLIMHRSVTKTISLKGLPVSNARMQRLREEFSLTFGKIAASSEGIQYDFDATKITKDKIKKFDDYIWEMRTQVSSINYCALLSKDYKMLDKHVAKFYGLLELAKRNYIHTKD